MFTRIVLSVALLIVSASASASDFPANDEITPPADKLAFVQGLWKNERTGLGVLKVEGNLIAVEEWDKSLPLGWNAKEGDAVFRIIRFEDDPFRSKGAPGCGLYAVGNAYEFGGMRPGWVASESKIPFGCMYVKGKGYGYRFIGGTRFFKKPVP